MVIDLSMVATEVAPSPKMKNCIRTLKYLGVISDELYFSALDNWEVASKVINQYQEALISYNARRRCRPLSTSERHNLMFLHRLREVYR